MKLTLRRILGITALLWSSVTLAQVSTQAIGSDTVLVELVNLHCPRCRAVNDQIDRLQEAAKAAGVVMRVAPVAWETQSIWPDRVLYSVRDLFPAVESLIRDALFDGIQREGLPFENLEQVLSYLQRRQLTAEALKRDPQFSLLAVADRASSDQPLIAEIKADRLLQMTGASEVPVFVWVREGKIIDVASPSEGTGQPTDLVNRVLQKLQPTKKGESQ